MKIIKESLKILLCSMAGTTLIIILFAGLVIVEKNTRSVAFGDNSPFLTYEHENFKPKFLKLHFMGKDYTILKNNIY